MRALPSIAEVPARFTHAREVLLRAGNGAVGMVLDDGRPGSRRCVRPRRRRRDRAAGRRHAARNAK